RGFRVSLARLKLNLRRDPTPGKAAPAAVVIVALAIAVAGGGLYAFLKNGVGRAPEPAAPPTAAAPAPVPPAVAVVVWVDSPSQEAVVGTRIAITGWALDPAGIRSVEVRVDGVAHAARYGIARPDVALVKPGFPDSAAAGFSFEGDFSDLSPQRHELAVVAINRAGC